MNTRSSQRSLVYILIPLLIALQLATFGMLVVANGHIAQNALDEDLRDGVNSYKRVASQRNDYLRLATDLVANDTTLMAAVAGGQREVQEAALQKQLQRTGASLLVLSDLGGKVLAKAVAPQSRLAGGHADLSDASLAAQVHDAEAGAINLQTMAVDKGHPLLYQWVKTTVSAPHAVAHLSFAFEINDQLAEEYEAMTHLDFLFLSHNADGKWQIHATSFDPSVQNIVDDRFGELRDGSWTLRSDRGDYRALAVKVDGTQQQRVFVVVGDAFARVTKPFRILEAVAAGFLLVALVLTGVLVWRATHKVVAPLHAAVHQDSLTGLANRRLFERNLELAAENLASLHRGFTVMLMDLNKFKAVNDTLGHAAGDQVLQEAARRIRAVVRASDTVARLGGDEFAILLATQDRGKAADIAGQIGEQVRQPMVLADGTPAEVGVSIGIALAPEHGADGAGLLHLADTAMYAAKVARSGFAFAQAGQA